MQHLFRILPALIPILALEFDFPLWQLGLLVTVYYLGSGFAQAPMGILVDRFNTRYVLPPGAALMGVGYLIFALSIPLAVFIPSPFITASGFTAEYLVAVIGVFISGLGASVIHPAGYALLAMNVDPRKRGRSLGIWGSVAKGGDAVAPITIAALILLLVWNEILLLFAFVGIAYGIVLFVVMGADWFRVTRPIDPTPNAASDDETAAPAHRDYLYPIIVMYVFQTVRAFSEKGIKAFLPMFLVVVYGYSIHVFGFVVPPESLANVYFTALFAIAAITLLLTGYLVDRYDHRKVLMVYLLLSLVTLLTLSTGLLSPLLLLIVLMVFGASFWGLVAARDAVVSEVSPIDKQGRAFGYLMTMSHLVGAIAPTVIGLVADGIGIQATFAILSLFIVANIITIALLFHSGIYRGKPTIAPADAPDV